MLVTLRTHWKTQGYPLSSLYAPIPKFTLFLSVSALYASAVPRIGSAGAKVRWLKSSSLMGQIY